MEDAGVERHVVILETLLPDPQQALDHLLSEKNSTGDKLVAHWRLAAKDIGAGAHEVRLEPAGAPGGDPALLASGSRGAWRMEVVLRLAHATPAEAEGLKQAMKRAAPFKVIVLSHEVDP